MNVDTMILRTSHIKISKILGFNIKFGNAHWRTKLNASPGGGAAAVIELTAHCKQRPKNGALKGLLLANHSE